MAVAVYGIKVLKESTVTGTVSNRKKKSGNANPRPALDPTKLKAIRGNILFQTPNTPSTLIILTYIFVMFQLQ